MKVSELAERAGIAPSAVRWYESAGVIPPAPRQPNGYREYAEEDLTRLRLIVSLRRLGLGPGDAGRMARLCLERGDVDRDLTPLIADQRAAIARQRDDLDRLDGELIDLEAAIAAAGRAPGKRKEHPTSEAPIRVLFVCTGNSARSQIAEAVLGRIGGADFEVFSASVEPKGVNPYTVRILGYAGINWSKARSKSVEAFLSQPFDYVITVCDRCASDLPGLPRCAQHPALGSRGSGRGRGQRRAETRRLPTDLHGCRPADPAVRRGRPPRRRSHPPSCHRRLRSL
jgi:arsenate reductase (thioredoxin)